MSVRKIRAKWKNHRFVRARDKRQGIEPYFSCLVRRSFAVLGMVLVALLLLLLGTVTVICTGPSPTARDVFVTTVMETSAAKFLARMYYSEEEIESIQKRNAVREAEEVTEVSPSFQFEQSSADKDKIELVEVSGATFKGRMMIVHDPSRVKVAAAPSFGLDKEGLRIEEFVENTGAVAGINGGGFVDKGGMGRGGEPLGLVIQDSKLLHGGLNETSTVIGFDQDDRLIVGKLTGQQALNMGLRDAVAFGPVFIVNGKAAEISGSGGGLNPRTVIGQRADGAVLLLVIDGRQPSSLGASYKDCIEVMLEFGAINAGNLDGGSSSMMIYQGEVVNVCASLYGSRRLPTAFVVM